MKALHLKQLIRQQKPGHQHSATNLSLWWLQTNVHLQTQIRAGQEKEQSILNFGKDGTVLLLPFCNDQKNGLQKQTTTIQDNR